MGDKKANEGQADESTCLMKMEESGVEEMELQIVTTSATSDGNVTGSEGNTTVNKPLLSHFLEIEAHAFSNRDIGEFMMWQETI